MRFFRNKGEKHKGRRQPYKGKVEQKWNPIPQVQEKGTTISNKFGVLDDTKEDERADNENEKRVQTGGEQKTNNEEYNKNKEVVLESMERNGEQVLGSNGDNKQHNAHNSVNDVGKEDRHKDSKQSKNTSPQLEEYNDNGGVNDEDEVVPVTNQDSKSMEEGEINEEEIAQDKAKINILSEQEIKMVGWRQIQQIHVNI
uniref:5' nucleotidase n=1 Tax=Solanum tuberosum TaxID=4113 RepID=M1DXY8_SOLTU